MAERGGAGALPEVPTLQIEQPIIAGLRQALVYLAAGALCLLIIITVVDVVGRYLLNAPLPGAFESVRALMALVTFSALPLVCVRNEHLRAGILDHLISSGSTGCASRWCSSSASRCCAASPGASAPRR
jgi:TRAP-type C4-dicarboxylate transport system permease small subunit